MKHIKPILLTMLVALLALPASARDFEYDGLNYTVIDEDLRTCQTKEGTYSFEDQKYEPGNNVSGELEIPGTVSDGSNTYFVVKIGNFGFVKSKLTSVVIAEPVATIGFNAFMDCHDLTKVTLPETVSDIQPYAFSWTNVKEINIPAAVTEIKPGVFFESSVPDIELPESVTSIGDYAFYHCGNRSKPFILPAHLESIGHYAFAASGFENIVCPESLKSIGVCAFSHAQENVFYEYSYLKDITLPASIESIGDFAFNKDNYDVEVVYNATNPKAFSVSIFNYDTYKRSTLTMPNASLADILATSPWNHFAHIVARDGEITPPEEEVSFEYNGISYTVVDAVAKTCKTSSYHGINSDEETAVTEIEIPATVSDGTDNYTVIGIGMQSFGSSALTSIKLPATITTIEENAFTACKDLTSIELPSSLTYIGENAFSWTGLTSVTIPENVTFLENSTFASCENLVSVRLPDSMTGIGWQAFGTCGKLTDINMPSSLTVIRNSALNYSSLSDIVLPESLVAIGSGSFGSISNKELVFPSSLRTIGYAAFTQHPNLTSVTLPASITYIGQDGLTRNKLKEITYLASDPTSTLVNVFYVDGVAGTQYNAYTDARLNMPNATLETVESLMPWSLFSRIYASDGVKDPGMMAGKDFEYDGLVYTVIDQEAKTCKTKAGNQYFGTYTPGNAVTGNVVIPGIAKLGVNDYTVVEIGEYAFVREPLTSVTIPETVKTIDYCAFEDCKELKSVVVPESVDSIGSSAFSNCDALTSVTLPASLRALGTSIFNYCESITSVTYNAENPVGSTWSMFEPNIYKDATLYMPNATLETVQSVEPWMDFKKIKAKDGSIGISLAPYDDFEYEGVWYTVLDHGKSLIGKADGSVSCGNLISYGLETMFVPCQIVSDSERGDVFTCEILPDQENPHDCMLYIKSNEFLKAGDKINVSFMYKCTDERSINTFAFREPGDYHHYECIGELNATTEWQKYTWSGTVTEEMAGPNGFMSIGFLLSSKPDAATFYVDDVVFELDCNTCMTRECSFSSDSGNQCSGDLIIPSVASGGNTDYFVVEIGVRSFYRNGLTSVTIPEGVTVIDNNAFEECSQLTSVSIPASLVSAGAAPFNSCTEISVVNYSAETPAVLNNDLFPESVYANATLNAPNATLSEIQATLPWNMFRRIVASDGSIVSSLAAGDDFEYAGIWYTVLDADAKTAKTKEGYLIEDGVTTAGNSLEGDLVIPAVVYEEDTEYSVVEIGECSFYRNGLTSVTIPEGVTVIDNNAFEECYQLISVSIPASLVSAGETPFNYCIGISKVNYSAETPTVLNNDLFPEVVYANATLNAPNASIADIKATVPWNKFVHMSSATQPDVEISVNPAEGEVSDTNFLVEVTFNGVSAVNWAESTYVDGPYPYVVTLEGDPVQNISNFGDSGNTLMLDVSVPDEGSYYVVIPEGSYEFGGEYSGISGRELMFRYDVVLPKPPVIDEVTEFEYEGVWYTVLSNGKSLIGKADGSVSCGNLLSSVDNHQTSPCQIVSDSERGNVFKCEILPDPENSWDCEFFIKSNEPLKAGDQINVSFMYKCTDERSISTQAHGEPGYYHNYNCIGVLDATTEWQRYSWSGTVTDEWEKAEGFLSIAFLLSSKPEAATFYVDDVVFELDRNTCMTREYSISYDSGNHCTGDLVIPAVVYDGDTDYSVVKIGAQSFYLNGITSVTLPEGVTEIGRRAFGNCSALTSVSIPASLASTEETPFFYSTGISEVNYSAETPVALNNDLFPDEVYASATLNTPNATLSAVQATVPWNKFQKVIASDGEFGFGEPVEAGEEFEFEGIYYSVLNPDDKVCSAIRADIDENFIEIREEVPYKDYLFAVVGIGDQAFSGKNLLETVSLPSSIASIGSEVFEGCGRLSSLIWRGSEAMPNTLMESIDNPNVLVYVDDVLFAPAGLDRNVVADGACANLVLTPGYPFAPYVGFTAEKSSLTKEFTQQTAYDGCSGWETIVLPFTVTRVSSPEGHALLPFKQVTDVNRQRPFWLYEADPAGEWAAADSIKAGMPYLIAMPNNPRYNPAYNVSGSVTFSNPKPQTITTSVTTPAAVTWASGSQFHSLWMPLSEEQSMSAMGLNVNTTVMVDGKEYAPGSAFLKGVTPKPLEAYVTGGNARAFPIRGMQSAVLELQEADGLTIAQEGRVLMLRSGMDRSVDIYSADGTLLRRVDLKGGEPAYVEGLPQGVCLVAGRKVMIR